MKASIIIPTYEDWPRLQMCLDALAAQTMPADQFEVLVANNNRTPEVPGDLRLPPNTTVIWAEKPGSYAARNVAMGKGAGKIFFFTDSDCIPDREWVRLGWSVWPRCRTQTALRDALNCSQRARIGPQKRFTTASFG
jgi:glycosyltransferase involved in cell wall biosynthesis